MAADRRTFLSLVGSGVAGGAVGRVQAMAGDSPGGPSNDARAGASAGQDGAERAADPNVLRVGTVEMLRSTTPVGNDFSVPPAVFDAVFDRGVVYHPEDGRPVPWAIAEWTVESGTTPVVEAVVRSDLRFHDGTPLTARDVAFTANYAIEQDLIGLFQFADLGAVDRVVAADETTVRYHLDERQGSYVHDLLHLPILPEHRWQNVSDPAEHAPGADLVGSGAFRVERFHPREQLLLARREDAYPLGESLEVVPEDAPYVREIDVRMLQDESNVTQALQAGVVDMPATGLGPDNARIAGGTSGYGLVASSSGDFDIVNLNVRRVPMDDPAFRQGLATVWDDRTTIDVAYDGIGAIDGDFPIAEGWDWFRPEPPDGPHGDAYEMPRTSGGDIDVAAVRSTITTNSRATHHYSFEDPTHSNVDDAELYVDGVPFSDAHTDTDGTAGQGALEVLAFAFTPGGEVDALAVWVDRLNRVGIPATLRRVEFGIAYEDVFLTESFDAVYLGWHDTGPHDDLIEALWGPEATDPDSTSDEFHLNAGGYTGVADLASAIDTTMDVDTRRGLISDALGTLAADVPSFVTAYPRELQPVADRWSNLVGVPGGVANRFTWLGAYSDRPPRLSIGVDTATPAVGQTVSFSAEVTDPDGGSVEVEWDVGDDGTVDGRGREFEYAFETAGEHTVAAVAVDDAGLRTRETLTVAVQANAAPEAAMAVEPSDPVVGEPVTFDGSASSDPDGEIAAYAWDLTGDGEFTAEGAQVTHTYEEPMEVLVRLRVTDDAGRTATATTTLAVEPTPTPTETTEGGDEADEESDDEGDEDDAEEQPEGDDSDDVAVTPGFGTGAALAGLAGALGLRRWVGSDGEAGDDG